MLLALGVLVLSAVAGQANSGRLSTTHVTANLSASPRACTFCTSGDGRALRVAAAALALALALALDPSTAVLSCEAPKLPKPCA